MPITAQPPPESQPNPVAPVTQEPLLFEKFAGINTAALRVGVPDEQAAWLDGFFPLAPRNLRTMYGVGPAIYTVPGGLTVIFFGFYNLGTTPYMIVFLSDGSVVQVNTNSLATTTILTAGTITSPSITNCGFSQFGSQYLIIVAGQPEGYWVWDGAALYKTGTIGPTVTITNSGTGYTSAPVVTVVGGYGTGVSLTASVSGGHVVSVSVISAGTGYSIGDTPSVVFSGGNTAGAGASITASLALIGSGPFAGGYSVSSLSIVAGGSLYSDHPVLTFVGGNIGLGNFQASAIVTSVVSGTITTASITNPGYYGGTARPTVTITDTAVTASATLQLMPSGVSGTTVETYQNRVWVANVATVFFTAPTSVSDFSTANGGGNFVSRDSFLQIGFTQLISSNGFLYLVADSSINYISGVTTSDAGVTTFTNQNADPEVGTPYPASVETYGRQILFANAYGIHTCNGAQVTKVSEMLDGVYNTVANFGGIQLASSKAVIFGRKVWMTLVRIVDPVSGSTVNKLMMWDGKRWWTSMQDMTLTFIKHQEINSVITAYGTNGTVVRPLFNTASNAFQKVAQSRLWDAPGGYQYRKTTSRLSLVANYYSTVTPNLTVGIDNEVGLMASPYTLTPAATGYYVAPPQSVGQQGVFLGMTIKTSAADMALVSAMIGPDPHDWLW